jgi:hypothetical protein
VTEFLNPSRAQDANRKAHAAAGESVQIPAQLTADHGKIDERRVNDLGLQVRIPMNQETQNRDEQQQQRKQRQETVVSDQCGKIETPWSSRNL